MGRRGDRHGAVPGLAGRPGSLAAGVAGLVFAIILVIVIPVGFLMSTSLVAGIMGALLRQNAERADPDSELITTND